MVLSDAGLDEDISLPIEDNGDNESVVDPDELLEGLDSFG